MAGYSHITLSNEYGAGKSYVTGYDGPPHPYNLFDAAYPLFASYDPFASVLPTGFTPGTDPNVAAAFQLADRYGSGYIDDDGLQRALTSLDNNVGNRNVRLAMDVFDFSNERKIGPEGFERVAHTLHYWRSIFDIFDSDRDGLIDPTDLEDALRKIGFFVAPMVTDLLLLKLKKIGGKAQPIDYDNFLLR